MPSLVAVRSPLAVDGVGAEVRWCHEHSLEVTQEGAVKLPKQTPFATGDSIGLHSKNGVLSNQVVSCSPPVNRSVPMSERLAGNTSVKTARPSGDTARGFCSLGLVVRCSARPAPSARLENRLRSPPRREPCYTGWPRRRRVSILRFHITARAKSRPDRMPRVSLPS